VNVVVDAIISRINEEAICRLPYIRPELTKFLLFRLRVPRVEIQGLKLTKTLIMADTVSSDIKGE
jgi:hypothetical protein